jgi:hypothetical protein
LNDFKLATAKEAVTELDEVTLDLQCLLTTLPEQDQPLIRGTKSLVGAMTSLCKWIGASLAGESQSERLLNAAKAQAIVADESLDTIASQGFACNARQAINLIKNVHGLDDTRAVVAKLARVPVPILCLSQESSQAQGAEHIALPANRETSGPFVIKVMLDIAGQPVSNQQLVLAGTLYDIHGRITITDWPADADYLQIDHIATLSPEQLRISVLRVDRPTNATTIEFNCDGHAEFPVPQDLFSNQIVIRLRATFLCSSNNGKSVAATIVGYHQLNVRVADRTTTPFLSGYRPIDARIVDIVSEIRGVLLTVDPQHLADFVGALSAISNYLGINVQQALYKEGTKTSEADFQRDILYHMRTTLGQNVEEAPRQGGGPTDIKYRSVIVELKVEKRISDRRKMVAKYLSQPAQYSSADGAQLGILCILDLTEKRYPFANPQSQITLETTQVHGFSDDAPPFPARIAVVVIDGNLRLPSSYNR